MNPLHVSAIELDTPLSAIPYSDQLLGAWAMRAPEFDAQLYVLEKMSVRLHLETQAAVKQVEMDSGRKVDRLVSEGIETIPLRGSLQKQRASFSNNTSTVEARKLLRTAAADADVKGIFLLIDSPGGTVAGTAELAAEVRRAAAKKPVYAFIDDLGASAAYWIAAQADRVFTNATGIVGSIGTYSVVYDWSAAAAKDGLKVHVVRSTAGDLKGAGVPGTEITPAQLADFQRLIGQLNDQFVAGVAAGRKLSLEQARALADGRVHVGQAAVDLKLVDAVSSAEDAIGELLSISSSASKVKGSRMSTETKQPATLADLKTACKGAPSDFLLAQLEKSATIDQAKDAWSDKLSADLAAANKRADEAETKSKADAAAKAAAEKKAADEAASKNKKPGVDPVKSGALPAAEFDGDPIADWNEKLAARMKAGSTQMEAVVFLATKHPELHQAYLAATNPGRRQQRLLADKYEE